MAKPYKDPHGLLTIGYATLIEDGISEEEADMLLRHRLTNVASELIARVPWSDRLETSIQLTLLDMAYNMGVPRLMGFKNMWAALKNGDYKQAGAEVLDSAYARQLPNRANKNAKAIVEAVV